MIAQNLTDERRRLSAAALAAVLGASVMVSAAAVPVRLLGVSAEDNAVLIESTEPVAYAMSRPGPLTVIIDLRNVTVGAARASVARGGRLAGVALEQATAGDGAALARIRVSLTEPSEYRVRSARNTIRLELSSPDPLPATAAPAAARALASRMQSLGQATQIDHVRSRRTPWSTTVTLSGNGQLVPSSVAESTEPRRLLLDFPDVASRAGSRVRIDSAFVSQVQLVVSTRNPLVTRVVMELTGDTTYRVERSGPDGRDLDVVFEAPSTVAARALATPAAAAAPEAGGEPPISRAQAILNAAATTSPGLVPPEPISALDIVPAAGATRTVAAPVVPQGPPPPVLEPLTPAAPAAPQQISSDGQKRFSGHPVSLDFQGADLRAVLRGFSEISGLNMVIDPDVQGSVDIILNEVPWDQALDVLLRGNQLDYTVDGTIVRIARVDTLRKEQDSRRDLAKSAADSVALSIRTFSLSYARASAAAPLIKRAALSARGDVQIDDRTNMLIVTDLPAKLDMAATLLATLDRPERQVEIEARVITTTREFARAIGVQWGLNGRMTPELGNTTNLAFPNSGTLSGALAGGGNTAVNLPAATASSDATSAVRLALGAINGAFNLDVALSALEHSGKGRILSTPRVTTQNNVEAEINQGVQIPVVTPGGGLNPSTTTYKDAQLSLRVLPQITNANTVIMRIQLENATPGTPVAGGIPINTQRANTSVQVADGMTTVLGGIVISNEQTALDKTPLLHRMPLLGWLFRRDTQTDDNRELLIFITPRILKD